MDDYYEEIDAQQEYIKLEYAKSQLIGYKYNIYRMIQIDREIALMKYDMYSLSSPRWETEPTLAACQKGTPTYHNVVLDFMEEEEKLLKEKRECAKYIRRVNRFLNKLSEYELNLICDRYDLGYTLQEMGHKYYSSKDTIQRQINIILRKFS